MRGFLQRNDVVRSRADHRDFTPSTRQRTPLRTPLGTPLKSRSEPPWRSTMEYPKVWVPLSLLSLSIGWGGIFVKGALPKIGCPRGALSALTVALLTPSNAHRAITTSLSSSTRRCSRRTAMWSTKVLRPDRPGSSAPLARRQKCHGQRR